jgi:DNA mismatch repair protein MutL
VTDGRHRKIHVLPGDVVSRIAAGEVIERPAAVVKELLENSVDAGSRSITVDIAGGGLSLIRVADDGEGMSREDAPLAFERHATSKLRSDRDVWSIRTMGFRGEALPSIASVSTVRVVTATAGAGVGTRLEVQAGTLVKISDAPPVRGTRIEVTDLFHNQPARKKFLKSVPTEFSHISRVVQHVALAWPAVHLRLTHNGQDVLNYPAASSLQDRISQVCPSVFVRRSLRVEGTSAGLRLEGWIVDPLHAASGRSPQELFVNRRPVRHSTVFHALSEGYSSSLAKGVHPVFVLFLEVEPERVDVNVHPTKREVRFSDSEAVHALVRHSVRQALAPAGGELRSTVSLRGVRLMSAPPAIADVASGSARTMTPEREPSSPPAEASVQLQFVSEAAEPYVRTPAREVLPLGQLNRTFLVAQIGGDLAVIDQHTAHERVLFERLVQRWSASELAAQPMLIPEPVELTPPESALLERHRDDLSRMGIEVEPFGGTTVLLRATPVGLGSLDPRRLIPDLLDDLSRWKDAPTLETRARLILASMACHGAVRSGRAMDLPEIKTLIEDWMAAGSMTTCPHGRRTVFRLSTDDLEKMFGRAGW